MSDWSTPIPGVITSFFLLRALWRWQCRVQAREQAARERRRMRKRTGTIRVIRPVRQISAAKTRAYDVVARDMNDHGFVDIPATNLYEHLYERHFECWNGLGATGDPVKWRRAHGHDHGLARVKGR